MTRRGSGVQIPHGPPVFSVVLVFGIHSGSQTQYPIGSTPIRVWQSIEMVDELAKKVEAVIQYYVRQELLKGDKEIAETRDLYTRANREQIQQMFLLELASNADDDREEIETVFLPLLKIKAMEEAKDFFDTETHAPEM